MLTENKKPEFNIPAVSLGDAKDIYGSFSENGIREKLSNIVRSNTYGVMLGNFTVNTNPMINQIYFHFEAEQKSFKRIDPLTTKEIIIKYFSGEHTCKETFMSAIKNAFKENLDNFNKMKVIFFIHPEHSEKAIKFIWAFEKEFFKTENTSSFFYINGQKGAIYFHPLRRWFRNPQLTYILLTLIRLANFYNEKLSLKENFEEIYKIDSYHSRFGHSSTLMQYKHAYQFIKNIMNLGFEKSFSSSKFSKFNWYCTESFSSMSSVGIVSLGLHMESVKYAKPDIHWFNSMNTYFKGFSQELKDLCFGKSPEQPKPEPKQAETEYNPNPGARESMASRTARYFNINPPSYTLS